MGDTYLPDGSSRGFLPGMIIATASAKEPPGWKLCYGQAVSRTGATAVLFAEIGTTYGVGDGSTTFNLPDGRGRVLVGRDNMGDTAAERITAFVATTVGNAGGADQTSQSAITTRADLTGGGAEIAVQAITTALSNVQPSIVINYLIKL